MLDLGLSRDLSPDSVIFTGESNFSMFSSTSASVGRCSFTSDAPDQNFVVQGVMVSGGPQPEPNKTTIVKKNSRKEKAKVQKLDGNEAEETTASDSARISFSRALKECREKRLRSEYKTAQNSTPPDLHHNSASDSSPRLGFTKQESASASTQRNRAFPSPGTPTYRHPSGLIQKGWSSEHMMNSRRNVHSASAAALLNGKALPSKWEDAERWIISPVSGESLIRNSFQRRPKSKSGPLGPPGSTYNQIFSPAVHIFERGNNCGKILPADSPFSAGQFVSMARSVSIHGCTQTLGESTFPEQQGDKCDGVEESTNQNMSRAVSRRDMATQMSPESSNRTSSGRISSFSIATPSILPELLTIRHEVRDDVSNERVTMTRWSKKNCIVSVDTSKSTSNIQREEARISSWENLQKAKAEASIRKLEMKLEKKRSSSTAKIMNRLRAAQNKAQFMRNSVQTSEKFVSFRRSESSGFFNGCFICSHF